MKVVVHIDRLVLDGVAQAPDLDRLRAAVAAELSRGLARTPSLRNPEPDQPPAHGPAILGAADLGRGPEALGRGIARAALTRMSPARDAIGRAGGKSGLPPSPEAGS